MAGDGTQSYGREQVFPGYFDVVFCHIASKHRSEKKGIKYANIQIPSVYLCGHLDVSVS